MSKIEQKDEIWNPVFEGAPSAFARGAFAGRLAACGIGTVALLEGYRGRCFVQVFLREGKRHR